MRDQVNLRPLESVILRLREQGHDAPDIATRIRKKPGTVHRILEMIEHKVDIPEQRPSTTGEGKPLYRVIDRLRSEGESYGEIGNRLNRSGRQVRRIEEMANL